MNNKLIRLTESDLHRIVKESVNNVLKEVQVRCADGQMRDLHGDNYDDWMYMADVRSDESDKWSDLSDAVDNIPVFDDTRLSKKLQDISRKHFINGNQNFNNYMELSKQPLPFGDEAKHRRADGTRKW